MIRTTAAPRSLRIGTAAVGVVGLLALAGCATTPETSADPDTDSNGSGQTDPSTSADSGSGSTSGYADGTYTANGPYLNGDGDLEEVTVTVTLAEGVVEDVEVTATPRDPESREYQEEFIAGIDAIVEGRHIDEISVGRVAGS